MTTKGLVCSNVTIFFLERNIFTQRISKVSNERYLNEMEVLIPWLKYQYYMAPRFAKNSKLILSGLPRKNNIVSL